MVQKISSSKTRQLRLNSIRNKKEFAAIELTKLNYVYFAYLFQVPILSYLERRKTHLLGQDRKRMIISMVNQALQTHSTKKKAWWALVWYLSSIHAVVLYDVCTVMLRITGTRMSGWVLRQNETIETTMKNTEMTPITWNLIWRPWLEFRTFGTFKTL